MEKLPSVYADVREESVLKFIKDNTASGNFCRRSDKETELSPGQLMPENKQNDT